MQTEAQQPTLGEQTAIRRMIGQAGSSLLYRARGGIVKPPTHPRQPKDSYGGGRSAQDEQEASSGTMSQAEGPSAAPPAAAAGPSLASGPIQPKAGEAGFGVFGPSLSAGLNEWLGGLVLPAGVGTDVARVDDLCASVGASLSYQADDVALGSYYFRTILAKWQGEITGMASCTAALVTRAVAALSVNLAAKLLGNRFFSVSGLMQAVYGRQLQPGYALRLELSCLDALEWRVAPGCLLQKEEWDSAEAVNAEYETRALPQPLRGSPGGPTTPSQDAATTSAPRGRPGSLSRIVSSTALECLEQNPWHDEADMGMSDNATEPVLMQSTQAQPRYGGPQHSEHMGTGFEAVPQAQNYNVQGSQGQAQGQGQAGFVPFRGPGYGCAAGGAAAAPYSAGPYPGQAYYGAGSGGLLGSAYAGPSNNQTAAYGYSGLGYNETTGGYLAPGGGTASGAAGVAGQAQAQPPSDMSLAPPGWGYRVMEASRWGGPLGG